MPRHAAPPPSHRVARAVGAVGRLLITSGTVILLLVAYQLWGTSLQTNRDQDQLQGQFESQLRDRDPTTTTATTEPPATLPGVEDPTVTAPPSTAPNVPPPVEGTPVGRISIPSIGLSDFYFVQGVSVPQLKRGAGHYPETPMPGQKGNAAIAGHRTTYGAPFHNIDKVKNGDVVVVETLQGTFRYEVMEQRIVLPSEVSVLEDKGDNRLTLTACHPKFSARERIILAARLVGNPVPRIPGQEKAAATAQRRAPRAIDEYLREPIVRFPGAWWGLACMALWITVRLLAWWGHRSRRFSRWIPYLVGTPACLLLLYLFFESFSYESFAHALNLSV